ncbi:hypothetical protein L208DRAFT_1414040 [Tricholoma matsutake]|nr:hypothetical protein L208DRAFT_1414040 [Tricholoma matsutake 945]
MSRTRLGLRLTFQVPFFQLLRSFEKLSVQYEQALNASRVGSLSYLHHDIANLSSRGMALNNLLC